MFLVFFSWKSINNFFLKVSIITPFPINFSQFCFHKPQKFSSKPENTCQISSSKILDPQKHENNHNSPLHQSHSLQNNILAPPALNMSSLMTVPENNSRNTSSDSCSLSNLEPLTQDKIDRYEDKLMHILMELRETEEQYSAGWKKNVKKTLFDNL